MDEKGKKKSILTLNRSPVPQVFKSFILFHLDVVINMGSMCVIPPHLQPT